jgi:hypothetical protein
MHAAAFSRVFVIFSSHPVVVPETIQP